MSLREVLEKRKTILLKEPLVKSLRLRGSSSYLAQRLLITERIPVPSPEVRRAYVRVVR